MRFDKGTTYDQAQDFFELGPNSTLRLTRKAASGVCAEATRRGQLVGRVEAGFAIPPHGFEARLDGIWDGRDFPLPIEQLANNNLAAQRFIHELPREFSIFLITLILSPGL